MEIPFEQLIRATEDLTYPSPSDAGPVIVSQGSRTFESTIISGSTTPGAFVLECTDESSEFHKVNWGPIGSTAPVFECSDPEGRWALKDGFLRQSGAGTAELLFRTRNDVLAPGEPVVSALIYTGLPSGFDFPDPLPVPPGLLRPWFLERGLAFTLLGKPALIRGVNVPDLEPFGHSIALAWIGEPLAEPLPRALRLLLTFLCGGWIEPAMRYTADGSGRHLVRDLFAVGEPLRREATPPLHPYSQRSIQAWGEQFDELLRRCLLLLSKDVPLDVSLRHLFAGDDAVDVELRDITLALDSIIESPLFEPRRNRLIGRARFQELKRSILEHVRPTLEPSDGPFLARLEQVLDEAPFDSVNERRRKFWRAVGFCPTPTEQEALDLRNPMSHKGYIEFDYDDDAQWASISNSRYLARSFVNRVLLALLGFHGHAVNYCGGPDVPVAPASLEG